LITNSRSSNGEGSGRK